MQSVSLRRSDPTVDRIIRAAFPGYAGRTVDAIITDHVTFSGTMWDGGCRRSYRVVRLADMTTYDVPTAPFLRRSELHENVYELPAGFAVVVHNQGRYEGIEIHANPASVTPLLPGPVELSDDEQIVLVATCSLKSSHGGVKNLRLHEARKHTGITPERYEAAKASLIARKLLNKAGAVTVEGQNARPAWGRAGVGLHGYRDRKGLPAV